MKKIIMLLTSVCLLAGTVAWAQSDSNVVISDMKMEPSIVSASSKAVIMCRVSSSGGPESLQVIAATLSCNNWNTSYSKLYDDGTHGDRQANDGVYSLEITAPGSPGEGTIVFSVMDKSRKEVESAPVNFTVR